MKNETDPDVAVHSTPGVWWLIVGQAKMMYNVWDATVFGQLLIGCSVCLLQAYQDVSAMLDRLGSVFDDIQTQEGGPRLPTLCWSGSALVRHRAGAFSSAGGHPATIVWGYQDTRRRVNAGSASQTLGRRWSGVESKTGLNRPVFVDQHYTTPISAAEQSVQFYSRLLLFLPHTPRNPQKVYFAKWRTCLFWTGGCHVHLNHLTMWANYRKSEISLFLTLCARIFWNEIRIQIYIN